MVRRLRRAPDQTLPVEVWVLVAAAFVIAIGFGLIAPVLPGYATSFDVGVTAATIVVSAFALFRLLFAPVSGNLVGRIGERPTYLLGLAIVATSSFATAFAGSYWQLLAFRAVGGIGSTMFTVSAMGLLVRIAPPNLRGRVSSLYATAFLIGGVLGPVLGGLLVGFSMRAPFLVYAGSLVVAMIVVWVFLPKTSSGAGSQVNAKPPMSLRGAMANPAYRAALGSGFANGWANFGVRVALLPLMFAAMFSDGARMAALAMAVFALGNALAVGIGGRLADLRGRRPMVLLGVSVCGAATVAFGLADNQWLLYALSLVAGAGVGLFGPAQQATVADVIGNDRSGGQVLATFQMVQDLGAITGPVVGGLVAELFGYGWAFGVTGGLMLLSAVLWVPAPETRPASQQS